MLLTMVFVVGVWGGKSDLPWDIAGTSCGVSDTRGITRTEGCTVVSLTTLFVPGKFDTREAGLLQPK